MVLRSEKLTLDAETAQLSAMTRRATVAAEMEWMEGGAVAEVVVRGGNSKIERTTAETERRKVEMEAQADQGLRALVEAE